MFIVIYHATKKSRLHSIFLQKNYFNELMEIFLVKLHAALENCCFVAQGAKANTALGAGKTTYLLSAHFHYGNGYLASYPDLT
jgi:hypothetical protein